MSDLLDLFRVVVAEVGTDNVACTPDGSMLRQPQRIAFQAGGDIYRKTETREGFASTTTWERRGICLPFQHVERAVPESVVDGLLVPARVTHQFRFHSSADVEVGDVVFMRVGNYPASYWRIEGVAKQTLFAMCAECDVTREVLPEEALEAEL